MQMRCYDVTSNSYYKILQSIQVVIYFGAIVALLYYYGIMQLLLKKMAWLMQITLGTTATESLNACACVFLGQVLYRSLFYHF